MSNVPGDTRDGNDEVENKILTETAKYCVKLKINADIDKCDKYGNKKKGVNRGVIVNFTTSKAHETLQQQPQINV
jgi:hypothetical protein